MNAPCRALAVVCLLATWGSACGSPPASEKPPVVVAPPAPTAPPEPPDPPVPSLRSGATPPVDHPTPIAARVERRFVDRSFETLLVVTDPLEASRSGVVAVAVGPAPGPFAFATSDPANRDEARLHLWIRRAAASAGSALEGELFVLGLPRHPGDHFRFHADDPVATRSDPALVPVWERALADHFGDRLHPGPWQTFASARLREMAPSEPPKAPPGRRAVTLRPAAQVRTSELSDLMETTTGAVAVQEALQHDRTLFLRDAKEKQTILPKTLELPHLATHPWLEMTQKLAKRAGSSPAPAEPLAAAVPAEFYYLRAASLAVLLRLLDQADAWGTPASHAFGRDSENHALAARYQAQLGLSRGPLTRSLGPSVIADLALVGSDPYLKEGSDVTLLMRVKNRELLGAGLAMAMAEHQQGHGALSTEKVVLAGTDVTITRSADGAVRQHRASVGDLELVSNSKGALMRVLDTLAGKHPKLEDEPDFRYMLLRDAGTRADALAYMGDRFVAEVVGPRQKIGEARREIALAELMTPGFAALLYGVMNGKSPAAIGDLVREGVLLPVEMSHAAGGAITWKPGEPARSAWGTPAALTPLIDLPEVQLVTESERAGYQRFARSYEQEWSRYIDPVAIRLALEDGEVKGKKTTRMTMDLRELPLLDGTKYRDLSDEAGTARFDVGPVLDGARVTLGIGEGSTLRRLVSRAGSFSPRHDLKFDWIGDWLMLGVLDRSEVAIAARGLFDDHLPQPAGDDDSRHRHSDSDVIQAVARLPLYAGVAIKNPLTATVALAGLRAMAMESTPGLLEWGESGKERDVPIVRIRIDGKRAREEFGESVDSQIFYAVTQGAILVSLSEPTLRRLIDDRQAGNGPKAPASEAGGEQLSVELASDRGRGLWTTILWAFEAEALEDDSGISRANAEALLRGAPELANDAAAERALAFAYFGSAPAGVDGGAFTLAPEGPKDAVRGTLFSGIWPPLPVRGSPIDALMTAIAHGRADLSFDDEGMAGTEPMRSLHARVTLDLDGSPTP